MEKRRVAILGAKQLLDESLEHLLRGLDDVQLLGPWVLDQRVLARLAAHSPQIILLAMPDELPEHSIQIIGQIMERFPELPLIQVYLEKNIVRFHSAQTLPARSAELIDLIRNLPLTDHSNE
ncbi:MAG: hypothetical protein QME21_16735 [Anaerolineales bacterium]|jgi:hypothetical protein|nr:hypothetical protein [Anaerolineales bacterium]